MYLNKNELEFAKEFGKQHNIPIRFTFTNCLLQQEHCNDTYGNLILDIFNNSNNEIICNSPVLEQYIRNKCGDGYKYISSITKASVLGYNNQSKTINDYYLTVLDCNYNNNFEFLEQLENKEKYEILCNPVCQKDCTFKRQHYESISQVQLNYDERLLMHCPYGKDTLAFPEIKDSPIFVSPEQINKYREMGFCNFKLEGRSMPPLQVLEILIYYLIKDDYQDLVRIKVQEIIW